MLEESARASDETEDNDASRKEGRKERPQRAKKANPQAYGP